MYHTVIMCCIIWSVLHRNSLFKKQQKQKEEKPIRVISTKLELKVANFCILWHRIMWQKWYALTIQWFIHVKELLVHYMCYLHALLDPWLRKLCWLPFHCCLTGGSQVDEWVLPGPTLSPLENAPAPAPAPAGPAIKTYTNMSPTMTK